MIYQISLNPTVVLCLFIYSVWFLLPYLLRIKENVITNNKQKNIVINILALIICFAVLLTAFVFRLFSLLFQTLQEWSLNVTTFLLDSIFDEKTK